MVLKEVTNTNKEGVSALPETEIARLVVARTFLGELEECITNQHYEGYIQDGSGALGDRFQKQFNFVDQQIPVAWHYAALAAEDLVPEQFQVKLADPQNSDHNRQHLGHVGNNVIIGSAYDLCLSGFEEADLKDAAVALMASSFTHDHLQIDKQIKAGHDCLGGLFTAGLMRLARLKWGLPFTERQEKLAAFSVYWHSYPEKMKEGTQMPPAKALQDYGEIFGLNDPSSLLGWLNQELLQRRINLAALDCRAVQKDQFLAKWLSQRLAAGDKRASYAPPFLSILRTMATGNKQFIRQESLEKPWEYFLANIRKGDVVTRTFFEDSRDFRAVGLSAFEVNWLKLNKGKKLDYLFQIASALVFKDTGLIDRKFQNYITEVIYECFREKTIDGRMRAELLKTVPNLLKQQNFGLLDDFPKGLVETVGLVMGEYESARKMMRSKGVELKAELAEAGVSNTKFLDWLKKLINITKEKNNLKVINWHTPVPEHIPVYCASLGVIK